MTLLIMKQHRRKLLKVRYLVLIITTAVFVATFFAKPTTAQPQGRRIDITVKRFTYSPNEITLKKGETVLFVFTSSDVTHGVSFKELHLKTTITKGNNSQLAFTPTQTGDFLGHCSVFCGSGHGSMILTLHVVD